jgi:hypothetical protein
LNVAEKIAKELRAAKRADECIRIVNLIDERRTELKQAIAERSLQQPPFEMPARRARAIAEGPEACAALDREIEHFGRELDYLLQLERAAYDRAEELRTEAIRAAAPGARSKLPSATRRVRKAIAELDAAIEALREPVNALGELAALPNERFPVTDAEAAELLELREELWGNVRHVPVLTPPMVPGEPGDFPRAHELLFVRKGGVLSPTFQDRRPPTRVDLTDVGAATWRYN